MNTILLQPTDILFFRDGRPMEGSLAGHGAAWPLPSVISGALLAALHRAGIEDTHRHRFVANGEARGRERLFGCLVSAGPFPVRALPEGGATWYFPRPRDLQSDQLTPTLTPAASGNRESSSLPRPMRYAVANLKAPSKDNTAKEWIAGKDFERYLQGEAGEPEHAIDDANIYDSEQTVGIAIDAETQTAGQGEAAGRIYSAHYLRLRDNFRMGVFAQALDKIKGSFDERVDLLQKLLGQASQIIVGGQQRACTARVVSTNGGLPLPSGLRSKFQKSGNGRFLVKWVLLTPAVWPVIGEGTTKEGLKITPHPGGWLPNWICPDTGRVLLKLRGGAIRRSGRRRISDSETSIDAHLVSALVPKPLPVTGWAVGDADESAPDARKGGAKSSHLAVAPGAVYYFEAASEEEACKLATALNWHGAGDPSEIRNRRSTLMGEKGFGLGVCGTWNFFENIRGRPQPQIKQ